MIRESRTGVERNNPKECTFYNNVYNGGEKKKGQKCQLLSVPQVFLMFHCLEYNFSLSKDFIF